MVENFRQFEPEPGYWGAIVRRGITGWLEKRLFRPWCGLEPTIHYIVFGRPLLRYNSYRLADYEIYESIPRGGVEITSLSTYLDAGDTVLVFRFAAPEIRKYGGYAVSEAFRMGRMEYGFLPVVRLIWGYLTCGKLPPWRAGDIKLNFDGWPICTQFGNQVWKRSTRHSPIPDGVPALPWAYMEALERGVIEYCGYYEARFFFPNEELGR